MTLHRFGWSGSRNWDKCPCGEFRELQLIDGRWTWLYFREGDRSVRWNTGECTRRAVA